MTKKLLAKTKDLTRDEWLRLRMQGIGGSDAAAAIGMSRYKSPFTLWAEKLGRIPHQKTGEAAYWGTVMEPILRKELERRLSDTQVIPVPYLFYSQEHPVMLAYIDGIAKDADGKVSLVEIKTTGGYATKDWKDGLPPEYYIQVQHYLAVCDLSHAFVAVLIGGNDFRVIELDRDETAISHIIALEERFWQNHVLTKIAPDVDGLDSTANTLTALYPKSSHTDKILPNDADKIIRYYVDLQQQENELKSEKMDCENKLKSLMASCEYAHTAKYTISWRNIETTRLDTAVFKKAEPNLAAKYVKTATYRKFSITETAKGAD